MREIRDRQVDWETQNFSSHCRGQNLASEKIDVIPSCPIPETLEGFRSIATLFGLA